MALFPHLEIEDKLQINDKTRLSGAKSFASKGADPITDVEVTAGANGVAVSVFDTDPNEWYLDWEFKDWDADIDATNNRLDFDEGAGELSATLTPGTYTLSALATEIQTQLNTTGSLTFSVSVDDEDRVTISANDKFSLLPSEGSNANASILPTIGYRAIAGRGDGDFTNSDSQTGKRVRSLPKKVTLTLKDGIGPDESESLYFNLYSVEGDALFSSDQDLVAKRSDLLRWVEDGRNTFKKWHRRAQEEIMDKFREEGYIDIYQEPLDLDAIVVPEDLRRYSVFKTLRMIFDNLSNAEEDVFSRIASEYSTEESRSMRQLLVRADLDRDGAALQGEGLSVRSARVFRL